MTTTNKLINTLKVAFFLILGSLLALSCESSVDDLGQQFFQNNVAHGKYDSIDVAAYNISNHDSIRSDASRLMDASTNGAMATLGAFTEPVFGMQKSSYVTQLRMSSYPPDFGTNAVADSAVIIIKPEYASDSLTTTTDTNYIYPDGNISAKKVVNTYPILKYGNNKIGGSAAPLTLNVYEINDFLGTYTQRYDSNTNVSTGTLLGSKTINGTINSVQVTKSSDNSELLNNDLGIRIKLDGAFFQNKIISQTSSSGMTDAASFIRYFKGLKISVSENDGYIFKFNPSNVALYLYYKNDVTSNGTTTRTAQRYSFDLSPYLPYAATGSGANVHFNQFEYNRSGTAIDDVPTLKSTYAGDPNYSGDKRIFLQGMGGPSLGVRISDADIASIKDMVKTKKIGIISARIRLYIDKSVWSNNYNTKVYSKLPIDFIGRQTDLYTYLTDLWSLRYGGYTFTSTDSASSPTYYDFSITETFKNIIEKEALNKDIIINVGGYFNGSGGAPAGITNGVTGAQLNYSANLNSRSTMPNRMVFIGTDPSNDHRAQLRIVYGQK